MKNKSRVTGIFPSFEQKRTRSGMDLPDADGIIVMGRCSKPLLQSLKRKYRNVVYVGLNSLEEGLCDQVICDGYEAARLAVHHLNMLGHTRIVYVGEQSEEARYRGYFDAMRDLALPAEYRQIYNTRQSVQGGYTSGQRLLEAFLRPTAVFCANDITAIGVMKALQENGVRVPGDMSVISIDNIELCKYTTPMLTSINIPKEDLGRLAVKMLLDRLDGGHGVPVKIDVPFTLLRRDSCAAPRK